MNHLGQQGAQAGLQILARILARKIISENRSVAKLANRKETAHWALSEYTENNISHVRE